MQTQSITIHATHRDILLPSVHLRVLLSVNHVSENVILSCENTLNALLKQIVDHACNGDVYQLITIKISHNVSEVFIETQDEGIPFDLATNKMLTAKNLKHSSVHLETADSMDEVWHGVDMGKNIWQLVKYI